jgi:DNA-binding HxlR family transcriptional regulator
MLHKKGIMRYKDLMDAIPDISQKMLSSTLRRLEDDHLVNRKVFAEVPPRVEYSLTDVGQELMPALQMMVEWAQTHFDAITQVNA